MLRKSVLAFASVIALGALPARAGPELRLTDGPSRATIEFPRAEFGASRTPASGPRGRRGGGNLVRACIDNLTTAQATALSERTYPSEQSPDTFETNMLGETTPGSLCNADSSCTDAKIAELCKEEVLQSRVNIGFIRKVFGSAANAELAGRACSQWSAEKCDFIDAKGWTMGEGLNKRSLGYYCTEQLRIRRDYGIELARSGASPRGRLAALEAEVKRFSAIPRRNSSQEQQLYALKENHQRQREYEAAVAWRPHGTYRFYHLFVAQKIMGCKGERLVKLAEDARKKQLAETGDDNLGASGNSDVPGSGRGAGAAGGKPGGSPFGSGMGAGAGDFNGSGQVRPVGN